MNDLEKLGQQALEEMLVREVRRQTILLWIILALCGATVATLAVI